MKYVQAPRDRVSQAVGLGAALILLAGFAYAVAGPAARMVAGPWQEVWVTIVRPSPVATAHMVKPR